jgi:hypothetical protein
VQGQLQRLGEPRAARVPVNGLADLTRDEFKAAYLGHVSRSNGELLRCGAHPAPRNDLRISHSQWMAPQRPLITHEACGAQHEL